MDQATQQNAAMVEQTSAAARNLTSEVAALSEQAAKFRIGGAAGHGAPAAPPARYASRSAGSYAGGRAALRAETPRLETWSPPAKVAAMADAATFDDDGFESF